MIDERTQNELRLKFNPDGSPLRLLQLRMVEMLVWFDDFCSRYDIKYWLSCGTCLGAVRHSGFIPWDDDIYVEMHRKDYERFCKLFSENEQYVLQTHENDLYYTAPFGKLRDKQSIMSESDGIDVNYKYRGIFIDIFPVEMASPLWAKVALHFRWKLTLEAKNQLSKQKEQCFMKRKSIFFRLLPLIGVLGKISFRKRLMCCYGTGFLGEVRDKADMETLCELNFEGNSFKAPGKYEDYLTRLYGDYMRIPKIDEIHTHMSSITFIQ